MMLVIIMFVEMLRSKHIFTGKVSKILQHFATRLYS